MKCFTAFQLYEHSQGTQQLKRARRENHILLSKSESINTAAEERKTRQGSCLQQKAARGSFDAVTSSEWLRPAFTVLSFCTLRQHNHPFIGNKHCTFLWGVHGKEVVSSPKEAFLDQKQAFPGSEEWRESWEKQNRTAVGILQTTASHQTLCSYLSRTHPRQHQAGGSIHKGSQKAPGNFQETRLPTAKEYQD